MEASTTQSFDRAISLLRIVGANSHCGIRFADLVKQSGLAKGTTHRLLGALERQGLIERDARRDAYHLGRDSFVIGTLASERHGKLEAALPYLRRLAEASGNVVVLTLKQGWHGTCLYREQGAFPVRSHALIPGDRHPLGVVAGGLAILAALSDQEVEEALNANAYEMAERYPTQTRELLLHEVERTRALGYAFNPGRLVQGSYAIGVTVPGQPTNSLMALSISAPDSRLGEDRRGKLAAMLHEEAARLAVVLNPAAIHAQSAVGMGATFAPMR